MDQKINIQGRDTIQNFKKRFNQQETCREYPKQVKAYYRIIIAALPLIFIIQIMLTYRFITRDDQFIGLSSLDFDSLLIFLNFYGIRGIIILKVFIVGIIGIQVILAKKNEEKSMVEDFINQVKPYLRLMIESDYYISSLLLLSPNLFNIVNFIVSTAVISFAFVFLENNFNVRDSFYIRSLGFLFIIRIFLNLGALTSFLSALYGRNANFLIFFHIMVSATLVFLYLKIGWTIYNDRILSWGLIIFLSLYISVSFNLLIYQSQRSTYSSFMFNTLFSLVVILLHFYWRLKAKIQNVLTKNDYQANELSVLMDLLGQSQKEENKLIVLALLNVHAQKGCLNQNCYSNHIQSYNIQKNLTCKNHQYASQRQFLLKLYIQCKYQKLIAENKSDLNTILNYSQFLYWRLGNISVAMYWLQFIKGNIYNLDFCSLMKFNGLLDIVRKSNNQFCENLFNRAIDIEHLIDSESKYDFISKEIHSILQQRLNVWKMIRMHQIDLSKIRDYLESNFRKIAQLSSLWIKIGKYLKLSNQWKQQFIFFLQFIKNQKLKCKILESFDIESHLDLEDSSKNGRENPVFDLKSILDSKTCCFHVFLNNGKAFLKKVSNNFVNVTGYSKLQAVKSNIDILLPKTARYYHHQMLRKMSTDGRFTDEKVYKPNQIYISNKAGYLIPTFKIFKEFVTEDGQLQYVCLLKKLQQKYITILCDQNFQIDGFTQNLTNQLQMSDQNRIYLSHFNLLSIIPILANNSFLTYQDQFSSASSDSQQQTFIKPPMMYSYKGSVSKRFTKMSILEEEKSTNQTQFLGQFYYSQKNLYESLQFYRYNMSNIRKEDKAAHYKLIKTVENLIKSQGTHYNCEIVLNEITNSYCKYYEVKIKKLNVKTEAITLDQTPKVHPALPHEIIFVSKQKRNFINATGITNIFTKESSNDPPASNYFLRVLKIVWIIYCFQFGIINLCKMFTMSSIYEDIDNYQDSIHSTIELSISFSTLTSYYQAILLYATNPVELNSEILSLTAQLGQIIDSDSLKKVIYQVSINTPAQYGPIVSNDINNGFFYNQIDFVYFVESIYQKLSYEVNLTANSTFYQQMNDYYYPSFSNYINQAKNNLHYSYKKFAKTLVENQLVFLTLSSISFIAVVIVELVYVRKFHKSMFDMMKIHCYFNSADIDKIIHYYNKILQVFVCLQRSNSENEKKEKSFSQSFKSDTESQLEQNKIKQSYNLNKKSKDISIGSKQLKKQRIIYVKLAILFSLLLSYTIIQDIYVSSLITPTSQLEQTAFNLLYQVPTYADSSLLIAIRHLESKYKVNQSQYINILINTNISRQISYQNLPKFGQNFQSAINDLYFSDACLFGEEWLLQKGFSLEDCHYAAERSFSRGLRGFFNYQWEKINQIMSNTEKKLSLDEINDYYRSIWIANVFIRGLIEIWDQQFHNQKADFLYIITTVTLISIFAFFVIMIVIYCSLFSQLNLEYSYCQEFYGKMMPQFIVSGEKIIKSKLEVIGFL